MNIAKLTKKLDGSAIYINLDKVAAFDAGKDGVGTRLVFDEVFAYEVAESVEDVRYLFSRCGSRMGAKA